MPNYSWCDWNWYQKPSKQPKIKTYRYMWTISKVNIDIFSEELNYQHRISNVRLQLFRLEFGIRILQKYRKKRYEGNQKWSYFKYFFISRNLPKSGAIWKRIIKWTYIDFLVRSYCSGFGCKLWNIYRKLGATIIWRLHINSMQIYQEEVMYIVTT